MSKFFSTFTSIMLALVMGLMIAAPALAQGGFPPAVCSGQEARTFGPEDPLPAQNPCGSQDQIVRVIDPWRAGCEGDVIHDPDCSSIKQWMAYGQVAGFLTKLGYDRGSIWYEPQEAAPDPTAAPTSVAPQATPAEGAVCTAPSGTGLSAGLAIQDPTTGVFHTCQADGSFDPPFPAEPTEAPPAGPTEAPPTGPGPNWGAALPWCLGALAILGLILAGIWLLRRRRPAPAAPPAKPPAP